jgi:3-methylcrotonyl-CoA carboxylase alpha subunit
VHRRFVDATDGDLWVSGGRRHRRFALVSRDERAHAREAAAGSGDSRNLRAPFPGLVTSVEIAAGESVEAGRLLVVMEAMKMVHSLRAAAGGAVRAVHCRPGKTVAGGELMVEFEGAKQ